MNYKYKISILGKCNDFVIILSHTCSIPNIKLNIIAGNQELLRLIPCGSVMTPHLGELSRLVSWDSEEELAAAVQDLSEATGSVVIVKGYRTRVFAPDGSCSINTTGNPGMAKGGSGDVLTGLVGGLMARGYKAERASKLGAWIHGYAGDCLTAERTAEAYSSRDLIDYLWKGFAAILNNADSLKP